MVQPETTDAGLLILDYGTGNLNSIKRTLHRIGKAATIGSTAAEINAAKKIILPGVGHFGRAMSRLESVGLIDALNESVLGQKKPVLGICLGMELMAKSGEEGDARGLGWIDAEAVRFDLPDPKKYKVPHVGWNQAKLRKASVLMNGVDDGAEFYFAHSYYLDVHSRKDVLGETDYGITFSSAIERGNIYGVQFHPEKSHDAGARLLRNFVEM
jgi:glutamine amidotransferase